MNNLPDTINYPEAFKVATPAGFDGVFDWSWMKGCYERGISPCDLDAVVEVNGQFLIFETKNEGVPIPNGQQYTFNALKRLPCVTLVVLYGKLEPKEGLIFLPKYKKERFLRLYGRSEMRKFCRAWFLWADRGTGEFDYCPIGEVEPPESKVWT